MKSGVVRSGVGLGGDQRVTNRYHEPACRGNLRRIPHRYGEPIDRRLVPAVDIGRGGFGSFRGRLGDQTTCEV